MLSKLDPHRRRGVRLGVAGAVLAFLALTGVPAVAIRPYLPPDELYHVGHAVTVLDGRLPALTTPLPGERVPLSAALSAGGVVMVAWLALLLVPGRPRVAVGAAWLATLLPGLPHVSAFVYNDWP